MSMAALPLQKGDTITLDANGNGQLTLGPDQSSGPATWHCEVVFWTVDDASIGVSPIPRIQIYIGSSSPQNLVGQDYDGSFGSGTSASSLNVTRGQELIAVWTGGHPGGSASLTVTGTME
jgi:hypothetical protein